MLGSLGIRSAPTCSCKRRALEMNFRGPDWCEQNIDNIVGWLEEEAKKRRLPFIKTVAKLMVQRAISKSRRLLAKANAKT
jgi:aminoglycoside N3'-acetyltransferase